MQEQAENVRHEELDDYGDPEFSALMRKVKQLQPQVC